MHIIAHRGYWLSHSQKNTKSAFERAFSNGIGIETDVRDYCKEVVISHGFPTGKEMRLNELLEIRRHYQQKNNTLLPLALHLNSCGLGDPISQILQDMCPADKEIFCFGNPVADLNYCVHKKDPQLPMFTTISDACPYAPFFDKTCGVWYDAYQTEINFERLHELLSSGKKVAVTSVEHFGKNHMPFWEKIKQTNVEKNSLFYLCTNFPNQALDFFDEV